MAAPRQSFYHNSAWHTIEEPYIYDGGEWKSVHNVWLRDAGAWKNSHKTAPARYDGFSGTSSEYQLWISSSATWDANQQMYLTPVYTVPAGVHYIDVTMRGAGGGGAGNKSTSGDSSSGRHYSCAWTGTGVNAGAHYNPQYASVGYTNWITNEAAGGNGGYGGYWDGIIEVQEGDQFQGEWISPNTNTGGANGDKYYLPYDYQSSSSGQGSNSPSAGEYLQATSGLSAGDIKFRTVSPTSDLHLKVSAGAGGVGGKCTVAARCNNTWFYGLGLYTHGYTVTNTAGADGANGSATVISSSGNSVITQRIAETTSTGASNTGRGLNAYTYDITDSGTQGSTGSIQIVERGHT